MELKFRIESLQDAILASAAVQAVQSVFAQRATTIAEGVAHEAFFGTQFSEPLPITGLAQVDTADVKPVSHAPVNPAPTKAEVEAAEAAEPKEDPTPYTKEQLKAAAAHNEELAALVSKRGKKTAAHWARVNELVASVIGQSTTTTEQVGTALKGQTAQQLQAALTANTVPPNSPADAGKQPTLETGTVVAFQEPGLEVRAQPGEATNDFAAALAERFKNEPGQPSASAAQAGDQYEAMSAEQLYQAIRAYAEGGAGLFWMRNVVDAGGGDASKLSVEHMKNALRNPNRYFPSAA